MTTRKLSADLLVLDGLHDDLIRSQPVVTTSRMHDLPSAEIIRERVSVWEKMYQRAKSTATVKAVRADWQVFLAWCEQAGKWALPVSTEDFIQFLDDQRILGKKRATINRYVNTVRLIHGAAQLPDPTEHPHWKLSWEGIIRGLVEVDRNSPTQTEPLKSMQIQQILAVMGEAPIDLRDAALLCLASDTLCRESELTQLRLEDFHQAGDGWTVDIRRSKANQEGLGDTRFCSNQTKHRVDVWCQAAGISGGRIFLSMGRAKPVGLHQTGKPLAPAEVARIFRRRAMIAGIENAEKITGHSTRVGSVVELLEDGATLVDAQFAGGWKDMSQVLNYGRRAKAGQNAMAVMRSKKAI